MIGSNGRRMLGITLAHVQAWNTWWDDYHNTPEGLAKLIADIGIPDDRDAQRVHARRSSTASRSSARPEGDGRGRARRRFAEHIRELGEAGADEVIVVASPITERSIRDARRTAAAT